MDAAVFAELQAALGRENYAKAIEICNKIRSKNPEDEDAIKIKCVALIRQEKFDKALELAVKYPVLASERVYCLYRLKKDDEALALLPAELNSATASPAVLHLAAQLHFRKGDYERAIAIYEELLANAKDGDDVMELQTNLLAAYTSAGRTQELAQRDIPTDDSFEVAFNKSFIAIASGDWQQAEELLTESEKLCREVLEADGASATEVENELAIIRTQLAFVKQMQGDVDGALSDYRNILKLKLSNQAVGAVASNNIVTIRADRDLFDSLKRLKSIESIVLSDKLAPAQQEAILANRALVLCLMNKIEECRESVATLKKLFPESRALSEITVFLALKDQNPAEAIAALETDASTSGRLGLAHLYLAQGQVKQAAKCVASISSIAHTPGTVATLVALFEAAGDASSALQVLQDALEHHKQLDFTSREAMKIREGDCAFKVQKKQYKAAAEAYLELMEGENAGALDPELRLQSLASLVVALSFSDPQAAEMRCGLLPAVPECEVDPVELEQQAKRSSRLASKLVDAGDKKNERKRAAKNPERVARKRAKRREAHLTKLRSRDDYNASIGLINPDPERWIPRKQRSYAKRGRRGRNRFVGAQGAGMGTDKDAAKLDAAARAAKKAEVSEEKKAVVVSSDSSALRRKAKKKRR
ncbi:hypothetical protein Poli38472_009893 [Pythium oligandrum]|uniref:Signal recognition particle subunit SRP72 n=1 Tax=Pythium oligandrum TaxID=41045 RepID=A0A8K1FG56_PYTOL|nr:hypothetical protein Poli38472_009893 [Pythium oligandrum]|eukprot:TMW62400.1 hypothetical protein Poli38472_009893 [Pythium oligandrum]